MKNNLNNQAQYPKNTWELIKYIAKRIPERLLKALPITIAFGVGSWLLHTFLLVYTNEGFNPDTWLGQNILNVKGKLLSSTLLWTMVGAIIPMIISFFKRGGSPIAYFKSFVKIPADIEKANRSTDGKFLPAMCFACSATLLCNVILSGVSSIVAGGIVVSSVAAFITGRGSVFIQILRMIVQDIQLFILKRKSFSFTGDNVLLIVGACGISMFVYGLIRALIVSPLLQGMLDYIWIALAIFGIFAIVQKNKAPKQFLFFIGFIGIAALLSDITSLRILADDGGWAEAGGTFTGWVTSEGALTAVLSGLPTSIGGIIGTYVSSIIGSIPGIDTMTEEIGFGDGGASQEEVSNDGTKTETDSDGYTYITMPDGTQITRDPNGYETTKYPDGTVKYPEGTVTQTNSDGSVTNTLPDGSVVTAYPDGSKTGSLPDGTTYTKSADGRETMTSPDGTVTTEFPDGTVEQTNPDGTRITEMPDGTQTTFNPDGSVLTENPDGTAVKQNANGSTATRNVDGLLTVTYPDGTSTTLTPDGYMITKDADGKTRTYDKDNNLTKVEDPSGASGTFDSNGNLTGMTMPDGNHATVDKAGTITYTSDGITIKITSDGKMSGHGKLLDGTKVTINEDETITAETPNGEICTTDMGGNVIGGTFSLPDGRTVNIDEHTGMTTVTNKAGEKATVDSEGKITYDGPDGSAQVGADGSYTEKHPDGSIITANPDGSNTATGADGSKWHANPDGTGTMTQSDGTVWTANKDGTTTIEKEDGTKIIGQKDGTLDITHPDGKKETIKPEAKK